VLAQARSADQKGGEPQSRRRNAPSAMGTSVRHQSVSDVCRYITILNLLEYGFSTHVPVIVRRLEIIGNYGNKSKL
jgi:hypothetical protein